MPFVFNSNYIEDFKELKDQFISYLILYYYNLDFKLILETDTSNRVIMRILLQLYLDSK